MAYNRQRRRPTPPPQQPLPKAMTRIRGANDDCTIWFSSLFIYRFRWSDFFFVPFVEDRTGSWPWENSDRVLKIEILAKNKELRRRISCVILGGLW